MLWTCDKSVSWNVSVAVYLWMLAYGLTRDWKRTFWCNYSVTWRNESVSWNVSVAACILESTHIFLEQLMGNWDCFWLLSWVETNAIQLTRLIVLLRICIIKVIAIELVNHFCRSRLFTTTFYKTPPDIIDTILQSFQYEFYFIAPSANSMSPCMLDNGSSSFAPSRSSSYLRHDQ